jgi:transposase
LHQNRLENTTKGAFPPPAIVGIDDWASRRNHRYGTLICDLERHATIALLPDREPATAEAGLAQQSQIYVVSMSSPAIVEAATRSQRGARFRTWSRSLTGGI